MPVKNGPGRPALPADEKKHERIYASATMKEIAQVDKRARKLKISRMALARRAIADFMGWSA